MRDRNLPERRLFILALAGAALLLWAGAPAAAAGPEIIVYQSPT